MKLLITGATGFIGKNFLKVMDNSSSIPHENIFLFCSKKIDGYPCVIHHNYQATKEAFIAAGCHAIDCVVHLGAFTPKRKEDSRLPEENTSNITNTLALLNALPNIPNKFIFASTLDVYGEQDSIIDESSKTNPTGLYGMSKLYCEKMLEAWAEQQKVTLSILRIGHIYGCGEEMYQKIIPSTIRKLLNNDAPQLFTSGEELRAFMHVNDCCRVIKETVLKEDSVGMVNVVSSQKQSIIQTMKMLCEISGKEMEPHYVGTNHIGVDIYFNASKCESIFGKETVKFYEGLKEEFFYMKEMNTIKYDYIFLDLDGPVLDGTLRHYQCYLSLVERYGGTPISKDAYWESKRSKMNRVELLEKTKFQGTYNDYINGWMEIIETPEFLRFDKKKPNIEEALTTLKTMCKNLVLLTMRNHNDLLQQQLTEYDLLNYFDRIISCSSYGETPKYTAIKDFVFETALVIGDTEEDEKTAKLLNVPFWAITNGLRTKECLHADRYYAELCEIINKQIV